MRRIGAWLCGGCGALAGLAAAVPALDEAWLQAAALHLAGVGGVLAAWRLRPPVPCAGHAPLLAIPACGPAMAWLHALGGPPPIREAAPLHDLVTGHDRVQRTPPDPAALAPLEDVLCSDASDDLKRSAIENLARIETPEAVEVLVRARAHPSPEIRACAISALDHLEQRLAERIDALERAVRTDDDPVTHLHLAQACFDCSYYHVATDQRRRGLLERAFTAAERACDGGGAQALLLAGRILLELDRHTEADDRFQRYLAQHGEDVKGLLWHAEALFRLGRYREVRLACQRVRALGNVPARMEPAMWMWV
jgi:tetratricopeptide (TPR) repeat protein